jgi:hypothetical protein
LVYAMKCSCQHHIVLQFNCDFFSH